jgi:hypothetical protein
VEKIEAASLWRGACCLASSWLVVFLFFVFRVAVSKYRLASSVFDCNLLLWESDIGEEVKAWTGRTGPGGRRRSRRGSRWM